jgi:hypothetical protein
MRSFELLWKVTEEMKRGRCGGRERERETESERGCLGEGGWLAS